MLNYCMAEVIEQSQNSEFARIIMSSGGGAFLTVLTSTLISTFDTHIGYGNPSSLSSSITNVLYTDEEDPWRKCPKPYVLIGMQCLFFR